MCMSQKGRHGSRLQDGKAHRRDHDRWSRRGFLKALGVASAGSALMVGNTPVKAMAQSALPSPLRGLPEDRVLVLLQLDGGNDGLNTIVPVENDIYFQARPNLALTKSQTLTLTDDLGLHPSLEPLVPLYDQGQMAIVQNVGYPLPDLSHFRSTDIWMSASDSTAYDNTGWAGRYLSLTNPDFETEPTDYPLAVQVGGSSMLFRAETEMGMSLVSEDVFESLVERGVIYETADLPGTAWGNEVAYMRDVANASYRYAGAVQTAALAGTNVTEYPEDEDYNLGNNLSIISRLIKGNLGARIYLVSLGGFDTHAEQLDLHASLLDTMARSVAAFFEDLAADGKEQDVLVMTFSEFGRRVDENGSDGTDHGTSAPLFLFGPGVQGGLHGSQPDLNALDEYGNMLYEDHFRDVYATVLQDWFGLPADQMGDVLDGEPEMLPLIADPVSTSVAPEPVPASFTLHQNYPNPFNPTTTVRYTLQQSAPVRLEVFDAQGRHIRTLVDAVQPAGSYNIRFDAERLPSGAYAYRLTTDTETKTRLMMLVR